jgi:hypothetical protein
MDDTLTSFTAQDVEEATIWGLPIVALMTKGRDHELARVPACSTTRYVSLRDPWMACVVRGP